MEPKISIRNKLNELYPGIKDPLEFVPLSGGSVNDCMKIQYGSRLFFCKTNSATKFPHLFNKEMQGLEVIAAQKIIQTPGIIDCFEEGGQQYLLLEWISAGDRTEKFWKKFGEQLALMHQVKNKMFGLDHDNYMGSIPQLNTKNENWVDFFQKNRLHPLVQEGLHTHLLSTTLASEFEKLYDQLPIIFNDDEKPCLVHGDLWSGNYMCNHNDLPVLIDPAVYFGHRSVDLGMTRLFGGFPESFYEAYHYHYPFAGNYKEQWQVCNLYPLLIHLLLFGRSYLSQIEAILKRFR